MIKLDYKLVSPDYYKISFFINDDLNNDIWECMYISAVDFSNVKIEHSKYKTND